MTRPWETVATVVTKDGSLDLRRRGEKDFLITIDGRILMSSATHRSEDALAALACDALRQKPEARVLVSGLGMGYTLRAALDVLRADAKVTVAELNRAVVEWCEGPLGELTANAARDPRVKLEVIDVSKLISHVAKNPRMHRFDAIVLDMYEGPQNQVGPNDPLYGMFAVRKVRAALTATGVFAVWCEGPSAAFERSLKGAGFRFTLERVGRGARTHHVYLAHATARLEVPEEEATSSPRRPGPNASRKRDTARTPVQKARPVRSSTSSRNAPPPHKRRPS
jgi:spermidine synthase